MEGWAYKVYIEFLDPLTFGHLLKYIERFFALVGAIFTLMEFENKAFSTDHILTVFQNHIVPVLILVVVLSILTCKKKVECSEYIGNKDYKITIKLGNILFQRKSGIVIPTNSTFDTNMSNGFISPKSIQGQFQNKYFKANLAKLNELINRSLEAEYPNQFVVLNDRKDSNTRRYPIGTVVNIKLKKLSCYFLSMSNVNRYGKPENVVMSNIEEALNELWEYLAVKGPNEQICVPVLGTGRGGLIDGTLEDVVHETISSYILAMQKNMVSKGLCIYIYPPTLKEASVTWDKLCNYFKFQSQYAIENQSRLKSVSKSEVTE